MRKSPHLERCDHQLMEDTLTIAIRQIVREEVERAVEELRASMTPQPMEAAPAPAPAPPQPRSDSPPELLFIEEVAEILRRSPAQIRWMLHNGTAPRHAKIGGRVVFKREDVTRYIESAFSAE